MAGQEPTEFSRGREWDPADAPGGAPEEVSENERWHPIREVRENISEARLLLAAETNNKIPRAVAHNLRARHPQISRRSARRVAAGFRTWVYLARYAPDEAFFMPSVAVASFWELFSFEFAAWSDFTKAYEVSLSYRDVFPPRDAYQLEVTLLGAQLMEHRKPWQLPPLFAMDEKVGLTDGRLYQMHRASDLAHVCPHTTRICLHYEPPDVPNINSWTL